MPRLRPYVDADWEAVLDLCLVAFAPACESLGRLPQTESLAHADPDWRTSIGRYLRSLTRSGERRRLLVAELRGSLVGVVHHEVDAEMQSGSIGVSAVHPAWQGKGIGSLMYQHVLDAMRAQGLKYATADTEGDACARQPDESTRSSGSSPFRWFTTSSAWSLPSRPTPARNAELWGTNDAPLDRLGLGTPPGSEETANGDESCSSCQPG